MSDEKEPVKQKKNKGGRPRKRTSLGTSQLAKWLHEEGWSQDAVSVYLSMARGNVRKYLSHPEEHLCLRQLMMVNMMLPSKTFTDVINSITMAPISTDIYVEEESIITPTQKRKQWFDI